MTIAKCVGKAVDAILRTDSRVATFYLSEKQTIRVSRRRVKGRVPKGPEMDLVVTIGRPNFAARLFIKTAKKAGEPFPIRQVHLIR